MTTASSTRLFVILARDGKSAVIFRRGPTRQVLLIKWDLRRDTFELGQWFRGRIYERRCDLSPKGDYLIYFAAKHVGPFGTWTAISKPPYLTALALWPKGDAWGGGGMFDTEHAVQLNHSFRDEPPALADGYTNRLGPRVYPCGPQSGGGEDWAIYDRLLARDGWTLTDRGLRSKTRIAKISFGFERPIVHERIAKSGNRLVMQIRGIGQQNGARYWMDYQVIGKKGQILSELPRTDWADWHGSDLLFSKDGKLFRWKRGVMSAGLDAAALTRGEIADFSALRFEPRAAPAWATIW